MAVTFLTPDDLQSITGRVAALEATHPPVPFDPSALQSSIAALEARVAALEVVPDPDPQPDPQPTELNLQLLGGWRLTGEFSRGQLAIDHAAMRAFVVGHARRNEVYEYKLPAMGVGSDINAYPKVVRTNLIPGWWSSDPNIYANGIIYEGGQLKVAARKFYDTAPPSTTVIKAQDGTQQNINLPRQRFAGFVKSPVGYELGCGGYESGQGSAYGPTLAKLDGTILINHDLTNTWAKRCPREPNYYPSGHVDSWVALEPRDTNGDGVKEGVWACDTVSGGGLRFPHGIYYWAWMGLGDLDYGRQNETFAAPGQNKTYLYRFDPVTYKLIGWKEFGDRKFCGQEISPDGKYVYLIEGNAWASGMHAVDPVLKVYEVK